VEDIEIEYQKVQTYGLRRSRWKLCYIVIVGKTTIDFTSQVKSSAQGEHLTVSGPRICSDF
jgi:hypothetical protein